MQILKRALLFPLAAALCCAGLSFAETAPEAKWHVGFGRRQILPNPESDQPLYIAGYNSGMEITGVLDYCEARALWLDTGAEGILIIGIDCVGLDSASVERIRASLSDLPNCAAINVYSTHTHAGADTLGLWGPTGVNGKNDDYMDALVLAAEEAARDAAASAEPGRLYFNRIETQNMYRDSRYPDVYDPNLYQLRFAPDQGGAGVRYYFYGAHAESLRSENSLLSRDFPGMLCDRMTEETGDNTMFAAGAIGGLIMTKEFIPGVNWDGVKNFEVTSNTLIDYALSIDPQTERELAPEMRFSRQVFTVPLDNTAFMLYKLLGILGSKAVPAESATGYAVESELAVLMLDDLAVTMIPGEIFPELVLGGKYGDANPDGVNPRPLAEIAAEHAIDEMLVIGLCNDELGYIVPPSDFLLNEDAPYLSRTNDYKGEDHYEETNSVGPACAQAIADAFEAAVQALD